MRVRPLSFLILAFLCSFLVVGGEQKFTLEEPNTGLNKPVSFIGRSDQQLTLDVGHVRLVDGGCVREIALLLLAFLGQNVTFECVLALDFSSSRKLETLLGTGFCFHLRHGLGFLGWWVTFSLD